MALLRVSLAIASALCPSCALASVGDHLPEYRKCLENCFDHNCSSLTRSTFDASRPLTLRIFRWNCLDDCKYNCMWTVVANLIATGAKIPQFHGKWPFLRLLGLQEPASVLFSTLNLLACFYMLTNFRRHLKPGFPMRAVWLGYATLCCCCWICSAVFHARDLPLTEKMDYFCAFASVLFSCYIALLRLIVFAGFSETSPGWMLVVAAPFVGYFCYHVHYLGFVHFDYGYNMSANVIAGLSGSLLWLYFSFRAWLQYGHSYVKDCVTVVCLANAFLLLELLDFAPFAWSIDAHALWHLATAPLPLLWTRFVLADCSVLFKGRRDDVLSKLR